MKTKIIKSLVLSVFVVNILLGSGFTTASNEVASHKNQNTLSAGISGCPLFPSDNFWNVPIDTLPVDTANSSNWINTIGAGTGLHMDFGAGNWDGGPIGIPYNVVSKSSVSSYSFIFEYNDESDAGPYPLPASPKIEHASDHHILTVDTDDCKLYEVWNASKTGSQWYAGSGAIFDLTSNAFRPDGWTSSDAAGLAVLPGLIRYDEVAAGVIEHALRFTGDCSANDYIWPARHKAQYGSCANPVPFGARFRLKSSFDISGYSHDAQVILQAFKTYGIIFADNGSNWYVSGAPSESWDNDVLHELDNVNGSNFEVVDTSGLMINPNSGATNYSTTPHVYSIKRVSASPTAATTFNFKVYFSESVTGVDATDFAITTTGDVVNAHVSAVSGAGLAYTVTVAIDSGYGTIKLNVVDDDSITDGITPLGGAGAGNGNFSAGESYLRVATTAVTFLSQGNNDGWTLESSETSKKGGGSSSGSATLFVGDDSANRQYRAILSFDTSALPDAAIIANATLKVKKNGIVGGGNPVSKLQGFMAYVKKGVFGTQSLAASDFQAAGSKTYGAFNVPSVSGWYSINLANINAAVSVAGLTQIRLQFKLDDNNNNAANILKLYSGNSTSANRPQLSLEYYIP